MEAADCAIDSNKPERRRVGGKKAKAVASSCLKCWWLHCIHRYYEKTDNELCINVCVAILRPIKKKNLSGPKIPQIKNANNDKSDQFATCYDLYWDPIVEGKDVEMAVCNLLANLSKWKRKEEGRRRRSVFVLWQGELKAHRNSGHMEPGS